MQGTSKIGVIALGLALLTGGGAWAQDEDKAFEGTVELLWRNVNVDGNEEKYNEDFDGLSSGGRIGNLWLNYSNADGKAIDYARVQAQGVGGDPFEWADIRVGASGEWDLRYNRRKQDYIYNLFESMDDEDGHSWETRREIDEIDLKLYPTRNIDVLVGYRQNERSGNSLFMKDVSRDLFRMDTPIDNVRRDLDVGLNWHIGKAVDIVFRQTRRWYENSFVNTTEGSLGLDQTDQTELNGYRWDQQEEESTANLTQFNLHAATRIVEVNFGYYGTLFGEEEFDTTVVTEQVGTDFAGAPLLVNGNSDTTTERDLQYFDLDLAFYVTPMLNLVVEASSLEWDQSSTGMLDLEGSGATAVDTRWDYSITTLTGLAEVLPTRRINLQLGFRTIDRDLERSGFGTARDGTYESDPDETVVAAIAWRSKYFHIAGDYEDGSVNRPFTQVSPFDTERYRVRMAVMPQAGMKLEATFLDYDNKNDAFPMLASAAAGKIASLSFSNNSGKWDYFLRYSLQDVETTAEVIFDTAMFGGTEAGRSTYATDNEQFRTMIKYTDRRWSAFLRFWLTQSDGFNALVGNASGTVTNVRIEQDYTDAEIGLTYTFQSGVYVGAAFRDFEYDDPGHLLRVNTDQRRSLDYNGTIVTLRGGFVFGRPKS